ncbi:MAG: PilZ domain-containing protein [Phycisphaerales bacterium]
MIGHRHISSVLADAAASGASGENARKAGRLRCELVTCDLGEVLDLSRSGMRVKLRKGVIVAHGHEVRIVISAPGSNIEVGAKVVWLKRRGLFSAGEAGIEFTGLNDDTTRAFAKLVRTIMA